MTYCMQYDVADHLARLLSKMPAWQSPPAADEEGIGRSYDNRADFLAERYESCDSRSLVVNAI